jgi:hypothetical protein
MSRQAALKQASAAAGGVVDEDGFVVAAAPVDLMYKSEAQKAKEKAAQEENENFMFSNPMLI